MNIYLLSQGDTTGYDTYSACVVAAETENEARLMSPSGEFGEWSAWANSPDSVTVTLIGVAVEGTRAGEILSSFHAG